VITQIDKRGACVAVDRMNGRALPEEERIAGLALTPVGKQR